MSEVDMLKAPRSRQYKIAGGAVYDGVVNGHPRYSVWVTPTGVWCPDHTGSVGGKIYVRNIQTNDGIRIFGINHWYWDDNRVCIWPVYSEAEHNDKIAAKIQQICSPGSDIEITCTREPLPILLHVPRRRPNFLFILTDEQRRLPKYENESVRNWFYENLKSFNMLREHGIEFTRHYIGATACNPSRTTLFTGQYPTLHGVSQTDGLAKPVWDQHMSWLDPATCPTIGDYFTAGGYRTFYKGKWHISEADIVIPGTRLSFPSTKDGKVIERNTKIYENANRLAGYGFNGWVGPEPHGPNRENSGYRRDESYAIQTVDLIKQLDEEWKNGNTQPFFAVCSFVNPHDICLWGIPWFNFQFPNSDQSMTDVKFDFPPSFLEDLSTKPGCLLDYRNNWASNFSAQPPSLEYIRFYYFLQKLVDGHIQEILNTLKNSSFFEDTIIVRTSDHGDLLGSHGGMHQKWHNAYEEVLNVDLLISNPKLVSQHTQVNKLTSHLDLLPTLLGLAGLNAPALAEQLKLRKSEVKPFVGKDLSAFVLQGDQNVFDDSVLFITDDEVETGSQAVNPFGFNRLPPRLPSHLQTIVTDINGETWKLTRFHDPTPFRPLKRSYLQSYVPEYITQNKQSYHLEPALDEFECYNLSKDPAEMDNLAHPSKEAALTEAQKGIIAQLKVKLADSVQKKCLEPDPYIIPPPPQLPITKVYTKMLKSLQKGDGTPWFKSKA